MNMAVNNNFRSYKFTSGQNDAKRQDFKKEMTTERIIWNVPTVIVI